MWVQSLSQEHPLEEGMAAPPTCWPGKSYGQRGLACSSPRGRKESDTIEVTQHSTAESHHLTEEETQVREVM